MAQPIFMLSGWSMTDALLSGLKKPFPNITTMALPGIIPWPGILAPINLTLENIVQAIDQQLPVGCHTIAGWSLGGSLAIHYARCRRERIKRVLLFACNPCFIARSCYENIGMLETTFDDFYQNAHHHLQKTRRRFYLLCSQGAPNKSSLVKRMGDTTCYNSTLLTALLDLLRQDFYPDLTQLTCPVVHVLANQDSLVPNTLAPFLSTQYPKHSILSVPGSHAFFAESSTSLETIYSILHDHLP